MALGLWRGQIFVAHSGNVVGTESSVLGVSNAEKAVLPRQETFFEMPHPIVVIGHLRC